MRVTLEKIGSSERGLINLYADGGIINKDGVFFQIQGKQPNNDILIGLHIERCDIDYLKQINFNVGDSVAWKKPKIEHLVPTKWNWVVSYPENLHLCEGVDIGCFTYIMAQENVYIGHDVQIGSHCSIYSVSTIDNKSGPVTIGAGVRIGSHSLIMPNVIIGPGLTIPAYSFIKQSILDKDELFEVTGYRMKD